MLRKLSFFALAALAASLPASALDIERIELKSGIGQPLLAEIPVVSTDPVELQKLRVQLASPATFARIGLERPHGLVASLQFGLVRDRRGKPVIRVTSAAPVEQEFLTFLVQVDWGDGRMVREYSVSLSRPDAIAAPMSPPLGLPETGAPGFIARATSPVAIPLAADIDAGVPDVRRAPAQTIPLAAAAIVKRPAPSPNVAIKPASAIPAQRTSSRTPSMPGRKRTSSPGDYGPVRTGDMLSKIAGGYVDDRHSLNQAMLALLRVNPDAFIGGNINLLRQGEILRAPSEGELSRYDATEAAAMVQEHIRSWREGRPVALQPVASPTLAERPAPLATQATALRVAPARLEISPAPDQAERMSALQLGSAREGAGDVLQNSAAQSAESQATRNAEFRELQARISELDQLQREQQALLTFKDAELAAWPAKRIVAWPWLATAFAVLLPLAWWLGRRGAGERAFAAVGPGPLDANADGAEHDSGDGKGADGPQPDGAGRTHSSAPAWHPDIRGAALESR